MPSNRQLVQWDSSNQSSLVTSHSLTTPVYILNRKFSPLPLVYWTLPPTIQLTLKTSFINIPTKTNCKFISNYLLRWIIRYAQTFSIRNSFKCTCREFFFFISPSPPYNCADIFMYTSTVWYYSTNNCDPGIPISCVHFLSTDWFSNEIAETKCRRSKILKCTLTIRWYYTHPKPATKVVSSRGLSPIINLNRWIERLTIQRLHRIKTKNCGTVSLWHHRMTLYYLLSFSSIFCLLSSIICLNGRRSRGFCLFLFFRKYLIKHLYTVENDYTAFVTFTFCF